MKRFYYLSLAFILTALFLRSYFIVQQNTAYYIIVNFILTILYLVVTYKTDNIIISNICSCCMLHTLIVGNYNILSYIKVHKDFCLIISIFWCYATSIFLVINLVITLVKIIKTHFYKEIYKATVLRIDTIKTFFSLSGRFNIILKLSSGKYYTLQTINRPIHLEEGQHVDVQRNKKDLVIIKNSKRMLLITAVCQLLATVLFVVQAFLYTSLLV